MTFSLSSPVHQMALCFLCYLCPVEIKPAFEHLNEDLKETRLSGDSFFRNLCINTYYICSCLVNFCCTVFSLQLEGVKCQIQHFGHLELLGPNILYHNIKTKWFLQIFKFFKLFKENKGKWFFGLTAPKLKIKHLGFEESWNEVSSDAAVPQPVNLKINDKN